MHKGQLINCIQLRLLLLLLLDILGSHYKCNYEAQGTERNLLLPVVLPPLDLCTVGYGTACIIALSTVRSMHTHSVSKAA